jgi:hypothetical protein
LDQESSHINHQPEPRYTDGPQPESPVEQGAPLPEGYGDNRLVIMARDPYWFFGYWEFTKERADQLRAEHGDDIFDRAALVLRVYHASDIPTDGIDSHRFFDVDLHRFARSAYCKVPESGKRYVADLGLRLPDGRFISVLRSNKIRMPLGRVSEKTDSQWMAIGYGASEEENWNKFMEVSGGVNEIGRGSAEISKTMAQRWEFLRSVFSGSNLSSSSIPSSGNFPIPAPASEESPK